MAQAAGALFSRWSQENFFKYMRQEFNLDASPTRVLKPADPEARVVNPVRREVEKVIRRLRSRIAGMHGRIARARKPRKREKRQAELAELDREVEELKATRNSLPTHIRVAELPETGALHTRPVEERLLLDIIRMIADRAETRMMQPFITGPDKGRSARKLLRALLTSDASVSAAMPASRAWLPSSTNSTKPAPVSRHRPHHLLQTAPFTARTNRQTNWWKSRCLNMKRSGFS